MKITTKKCSSKEHNENEAIKYCQICKIYMCNQCDDIHSKLCRNHFSFNLKDDFNETFSGICFESDHLNQLEYFCKTHNKLCCASCITKIKGKGKGQHSECDICFIEDIKDEKRNKLNDNITILENLSKNIKNDIEEFKKALNKIEKSKEDLKKKVQKIFTDLRSALNNREDELLFDIDQKIDNKFLDKKVINRREVDPNEINKILVKNKKIEKEWNNNNLKEMINDCINLENNIECINTIKKSIEKYNSMQLEIKFIPEENQVNNFKKEIKSFGNIYINNNDLINSNILMLMDNKEKLKSWISPNKDINSELLYKMTRDGSTINKFHELCDNISNNLIIIQTVNDNIFGGYSSWIWNKSGNDMYINDGFLFNLSNEIKYNNNYLRIYKGNKNYGPYIYNKFYFIDTMKKCRIISNEFSEKQGDIDIKEIEIFKIII